MNNSLAACVFLTALVVVACGKGCTKDDVIPDDDFPTAKPSVVIETPTEKPTATETPSPVPTPTPTPTLAVKTFVLPQRVKVKEAFIVRAYVPSSDPLELYAGSIRLGWMGWDAICKCKTMTLSLNTAGERNIRFLSGDKQVASEILLVEE